MFKRLIICMFNIIFPPFAVMLLTGLNQDVIFNCLLFLLAVIPSHVHGFYISLTYFNRKRKVRRGIYPGKPAQMIYSDYVNHGGASRREVRELLDEKNGKTTTPVTERISRQLSSRIQTWDDGNSEKFVPDSPVSRTSTRRSTRRSRRYDDYDDYEGARLSQRSSRRAI